MPTTIAHALTAVAVGAVAAPPHTTRRYWIAGIACATLVDLDVLGRPFGYPELGFVGGHRALTHSVPFAIALGIVVTRLAFADDRWNGHRVRIVAYLMVATALHGVLDLFTTLGQGVGLLMPFNTTRFVIDWRPVRGFNEIWLMWLPPLIVTWIALRHRRERVATSSSPR